MKFLKAQFSIILVAVLFVLFASIAASAQVKLKHGDLSLLKGKTKVFILPLPDAETKEMVEAIKQYPGLTLVTNIDDADFVLTLMTQDLIGANLVLNGQALDVANAGPNMNPATNKPNVNTRIFRMMVSCKDNTGSPVEVWSKEMTDYITTQSIAPVYNDPPSRTRQTQEPSSASSVIRKSLVKSFLADLKKKTK